jgi:hypothetical protein
MPLYSRKDNVDTSIPQLHAQQHSKVPLVITTATEHLLTAKSGAQI